MSVKAIFRPGQKGTRKLVHQYGEQLIAVRYRYDEQTKKSFKTVELIIKEKNWIPLYQRDQVIVVGE